MEQSTVSTVNSIAAELLETLEYLSNIKELIQYVRDNRERLMNRPALTYEQCLEKMAPETVSKYEYDIATRLIESLILPGAAEECLNLTDDYESRLDDTAKQYIRERMRLL